MQITTDENGNVTISKEQYLEYLERDFILSWLVITGVDNWIGWDRIGDMPDFGSWNGTLEEYSQAYDDALSGVW